MLLDGTKAKGVEDKVQTVDDTGLEIVERAVA